MIKILCLLAIALIAAAYGHVLLNIGMKNIGAFEMSKPGSWPGFFLRVVTNSSVLLGVALQFFFFIVWLIVLSDGQTDLSFVFPLLALDSLVVAFFSYVVLCESLSRLRLAGTLLVCFGAMLICLDQYHRETRTPPASQEAIGQETPTVENSSLEVEGKPDKP